MTVLRTVGNARASKRWKWNPKAAEWSKISYEAGAWFSPREYSFTDLSGLVRVLERVQHDDRALVVRGALQPDAREALAANPAHKIRRRKHAKDGIDPSLAEVSRRWLMIDIDNWPLPGWGDLVDDPETAIDTAIHELLPEAFHDAECWWQLSSSAGFVAGFLKVHLFFWLSEPATNTHIKAVLKQHAPGVDRAPFSAAQPHYITAPVIEGGHDPLPRRTGWRKGLEQAVVLPALKPQAERPRPTGTGASGRVGGIHDALAFMGHAGIIEGRGGDGFHEPLRTATMRYAQRCRRYNERDDDAIKAELRDAIRDAPCRPGGNVETPYCADYYLDSMIEGAFALLSGADEIQAMRPHYEAAVNTVEHARAEIARHVGEFIGRVAKWHELPEETRIKQPAEHAALVVDVGAGKSSAARAALGGWIEQAKTAGIPHRVLWLVPTHRLGNDQLEDMRRIGLRVAVMRGREAWDPDTFDPVECKPALQMCHNLPAVEDAMLAGYDAESSACGKAKKDRSGNPMPVCPYHAACGYQRQKAIVAKADVVIASHQALFHDLPKEVGANLGLVVVDESWWQAGLKPNRQSRMTGFADEVLQHPVLSKDRLTTKSFRYSRNDAATGDLEAYSVQARTAFEGTADGAFVSRASVLAAGLTSDACAEAHKLEWQRKREHCIYPGQPVKDRQAGVVEAAGNTTIPRRAGIWDAIREMLEGSESHTGRLQVVALSDQHGPYRAVLLHSRSNVRDDVAALPQIHLDATMPEAVVRHYLPRLQVLARVRAAMPHMRIHQVIGGWGKTSIVPSDKAAPDENRRRENLLGELRDFVRANSGGSGVVITYQAIEDRFAELPGVSVEHFNNVAGLDTYGQVRTGFLIGRPLPDPRHLREAALALTGRAIPAETGRSETRGALMADGSGAAIKVRTYADADLEALRVAITEAEIVQGLGRLRGINRTAANPVDAILMADVVVPLPVSNLVRWEDVRLDVVERMRAREVVFTSASDAAKSYPDLFGSAKAAEHAFARSRGLFPPHLPRSLLSIGEWGGNSLQQVTYRPSGRGQQTRTAWVTQNRLASFREWLTNLLGELTTYAVGEPAEPPPNAPKRAPPKSSAPPAEGKPVVSAGEGPGWERAPEPVLAAHAGSDARWAGDPGWSDADVAEALSAEPAFPMEEPMPHPLPQSGLDQPGLDPGAVYRRGTLEPPVSAEFVIQRAEGLPFHIRGRPGARTLAPRSALIWQNLVSLKPGQHDCAAAAVLPDHLARGRTGGPEPPEAGD